MGSGNFLVGKGLSLKGFSRYIEPLLKEKGCKVTDILYIGQRNIHKEEGVLISITPFHFPSIIFF